MNQIEKEKDVKVIRTIAEIEIQKLEANSSAREVASKYIGKTAIPWIVLLVVVGVASSAFLEPAALPAVIGLVSTAVMAMISMLSGITGTKDSKEETNKYQVIETKTEEVKEEEKPIE